jgi:hypothetical protein
MAEPLYHCEKPTPHEVCVEDVHAWFELTYANYLVLPRSLMQAMPAEWQHRFTRLLDELQATFRQENDRYMVSLRTEDGRFVADPLRNYRYPDRSAVEAARQRAQQ